MWQVKETTMDDMKGGTKFPFSLREQKFRNAMVLYTLILLSANFVGDRSFQLFYFSYSAGTLVMQLVFCGLIGFTETIGFKRCMQLIWSSSIINLSVALVSYFLLQFPIPDFWVSAQDNIEVFHRLSVVIMFTVGYALSALTMVLVAGRLRLIFGKKWLFARVGVMLLAGLVVDMLVLTPTIFFIASDNYMALWNMISLISVKISLNLLALPMSYLLIQILRKRIFLQKA